MLEPLILCNEDLLLPLNCSMTFFEVDLFEYFFFYLIYKRFTIFFLLFCCFHWKCTIIGDGAFIKCIQLFMGLMIFVGKSLILLYYHIDSTEVGRFCFEIEILIT